MGGGGGAGGGGGFILVGLWEVKKAPSEAGGLQLTLASDVEAVAAVQWLLCSLAYVSGWQAGCPPGFPNWPLHVTAAVTLESMIICCHCKDWWEMLKAGYIKYHKRLL